MAITYVNYNLENNTATSKAQTSPEPTKAKPKSTKLAKPKGQLSSKCPFGVIVSTKVPQKNL